MRTSEKHCLVVFLDISGALDNLWWPSIVKELSKRRIAQNTFLMLKKYLRERTVYLQLNYTEVHKTLTKGCSQGSVLGSMLSNVVLDTLLNLAWPEDVRLFAYADDLTIAIRADSHLVIEQTVSEVTLQVAAANKINVNYRWIKPNTWYSLSYPIEETL